MDLCGALHGSSRPETVSGPHSYREIDARIGRMGLHGLPREWRHYRARWITIRLISICAKGKLVFWGIDDAERDFLREHTADMFELRSIISRARPHVEVPGLLLIDATVEELDEMYTLVEELTDVMPRGRRRELLVQFD